MSTKQILQKKLKAIVFTDMADFTSISAKDEQKAVELIQKQNEIINPRSLMGYLTSINF